jgi:hypothetical protein
MSIATPFKHYRALPFCVQKKTNAEITALAEDSGQQRYLRWDGTLAEAMAIFWNAEIVGSPANGLSLFGNLGLVTAFFHDDVGNPVTVSTEPRERVCRTAISQIGADVFEDSSNPTGIAFYFLFLPVAVYENTDTGKIEVLLEIYVADDVSPSTFYISQWLAAVPGGVAFTMDLTLGATTKTFTLYGETADTYLDELTITPWTY